MKVLIVSPYEAVNPHFETELEIAQRHVSAGDSVVLLSCQGEQSLCDFNPAGDLQRCEDCRLRRAMGQQLLSQRQACRPIFAALSQWPLPKQVQDFLKTLTERSIADLKSLVVEDFDIGYACLSSLVSLTRDPAPDLLMHHELLTGLLENAWAVYRSVRHWVNAQQVQRVYVFNGRFAAMRAVLRAARAERVECLIHERGSTHNRFQLFRNHLPHDIDAMRRRMLEFWKRGSEPARTVAARQWFEDRRQRVERNWKSFTREQHRQLLPVGWNDARHNVVLFCSSEDEFAAIGDSWDQRPYPSQLAGMQHLLDLLDRPDGHLTVRLHPNLKTAPRDLYQPFLDLQHPKLEVVAPDSPVDSYALLDHADVCVSYGSSVGLEAVYAGKPSVLLGPCFYRDLGGTYQPLSDFQGDARRLPVTDPRVISLQELICGAATPLDRSGALVYAYWMQENGIEYRYYQGESFNHGTFQGTWIYPRPRPKSVRGFWKAWKQRREEGRRAMQSVVDVPSGGSAICELGEDC